MPAPEELHRGFKLGEWEVLPGQRILRSGDEEEHPEPKVFDVLMALARRDGELVTREELIEEIWDNRPIGDEPINRCVHLLRGHLGDKDQRYVKTMHRKGYRLNMPVELDSTALPSVEELRHDERVRNQGRFWMVVAAIIVTVLIAVFMRYVRQPIAPSDIESLAVMPFEFQGDDPADEYLASGFQGEVVRSLHRIPGLRVKQVSVDYSQLGRIGIQDVFDDLGADAMLSGTLQILNGELKVSYGIADTRSGIEIAGNDVQGTRTEIYALQERLALLVRNELLGDAPQELLNASRPSNLDAHDRYMRGVFLLERRAEGSNLQEAIELLQQTINLDPGFGPAYLQLATAYALKPDYRHAPLEKNLQQALETVERGVEQDERIRDAANAVFGFVFHKQKKWGKAEEYYEKATTARVVDGNAFNWYSRMLAAVGRDRDALEQVQKARQMDPGSAIVNSRVAIALTWLGDDQSAMKFYERSEKLGATGQHFLMGYALSLIRQGRMDEAMVIAQKGAEIAGYRSSWVGPLFEAIADPTRAPTALAAIEEPIASAGLDPRVEITLRTILGDVQGAMDLAFLLAEPEQHFEMDVLFLPELKPLRDHPRFLGLMDKLGVSEYWDERGCTWLNDAVNCPG